MNTKLHAVTDARGRSISFFMTAGQVSDYTGAAALVDGLPKADWLLGDRGYDADWFRDALDEKGITPCILGPMSRNKPVKYDKRRYKGRNKIEIMSGRLKDRRRVATCTTGARPSSYPPSRSPPPFCSGYPDPGTTLAESDFWDSQERISLIHGDPAFMEAGDGRGLAQRSEGLAGALFGCVAA
jgi:transposase